MKTWGTLPFCAAFFCNLLGLSQWRTPDPQLRYHEVSFLTSHNSYAAKLHGYCYAQQQWTIKQQLEAGVRGLMLDTHLDPITKEVILCHRNAWVNKIICAGKPHMKMHEALVTLREFLEKNPSQIITIFLENYIKDRAIIDGSFKTAGLEEFILAPSQWDPVAHDGWPTIEWMQKNNKRLLIFNSIEKTELAYNQWEHVIENQWGALPFNHACKERNESRAYRSHKRYLYLINYFPRLKVNFGGGYEIVNSTALDVLLTRISRGLGNGYCKDRCANFISLDFIDEGDGMKRVNQINELESGDRRARFRCIVKN